MNLARHIGQRRLFEIRQAERGLIQAIRTGQPGANRLAGEIMPLKRKLNSAEWAANADLFMIELEAAA